jgi:guanylate kinase
MDKKLFVISGSSGVGKGTVINRFLAQNPDFSLSVSCTTRGKRAGEVDGVNYFYLSREEFETAVQNDEFLEWAEFAGNLYGTKRRFVEKCLAQGKNLILEIDTQGALQVKSKMPGAVLIFICPPSLEDLEARLRGRNTEDEAAIQKRLDFVKNELELAKKFDHQIINDSVENAVAQIAEITKPPLSKGGGTECRGDLC